MATTILQVATHTIRMSNCPQDKANGAVVQAWAQLHFQVRCISQWMIISVTSLLNGRNPLRIRRIPLPQLIKRSLRNTAAKRKAGRDQQVHLRKVLRKMRSLRRKEIRVRERRNRNRRSETS